MLFRSRTTAAQRTVEELISLSTGSRQGVFPIGAAAGAAMHRGNGAVAVQLAERALTELEHTGGMVFEPTVMLCIACLQVGDIERAETAIADLPDFGLQGREHGAQSSPRGLRLANQRRTGPERAWKRGSADVVTHVERPEVGLAVLSRGAEAGEIGRAHV